MSPGSWSPGIDGISGMNNINDDNGINATNFAFLQHKKHAHTKSIAVLKNTPPYEPYMNPIQGKIEKVSNSHDSPSRIGSNTCNCKRRHGESSVGKVASLAHVLHEHASIRAEIYLGTPAASHQCHPEPQRRSVVLGSTTAWARLLRYRSLRSVPLVLASTDGDWSFLRLMRITHETSCVAPLLPFR